MHLLRKPLAAVILPAIAYLGVACESTDTPTGARPRPVASDLTSSNDPTTRWVNASATVVVAPGTSCDNPGYMKIQDAVDHAASGDRINVCPGTYAEQVTVPLGKDNIRLRSVQRWQAVIKAPTVMLPFNGNFIIVHVAGAQGITILAFTITGPGPGPCGTLHYGVRVDNGGSADILGNHITQIRDDPFSGCQNGVAILVGRQAEGTTGSARIMGNVIDNYQKNGPTVDNAGSHAEIVNNRILGIGPTPIIAQNGVQASRGATAEIRHNFVSGNIYTGVQPAASSGILLFQPRTVLTEHNTATSNDVSIWLNDAPAGSMTPLNRVRASTFDGIAVDAFATGTTGNQVAHNRTDQNGGPGIGVYGGSQGNTVDDNMVEDNQDSGILLDLGQNNDIGANKVRNNGSGTSDATDGIRVNMLSTGNTIHDNHLKNNVTHDCHDFSTGSGTAGTANTWFNNHGETSVPPALCGEDDDDADFASSDVYGWDPSYPWYTDFGDAADFDWVAAYATIDTASLLQLLPQIRLGGIVRPTASPNE
ncbi:MAG TPA: right-handed parallel beta-helix repeat-containing protein [Gemmatimonadales bacterium]|nr:right-handed parallel beta-helix repeat-containing protein [Gemmatimonadales bacterium]